MPPTNYISKELAQWLEEKGCKIWPPEMIWAECWIPDRRNGATGMNAGFYEWKIIPRKSTRRYVGMFAAYSWYDILVTHAKEFWGDLWVCDECGKLSTSPLTSLEAFKAGSTTECVCRQLNDGDSPFWITKAEHATVGILELLQNGDFQKAEAYVREHSLFAKQESKCKGCGEVKRCSCGDTVHEPYSGFDAVA